MIIKDYMTFFKHGMMMNLLITKMNNSFAYSVIKLVMVKMNMLVILQQHITVKLDRAKFAVGNSTIWKIIIHYVTISEQSMDI